MLAQIVFAAVCSHAEPGIERWGIKTSMTDTAKVSTPVALTFDQIASMTNVSGVAKNDARYQSYRIPKQSGAICAEGDLVSFPGWIWLVAGESDGDYHIQVSGSNLSGNNCVIVEVPSEDPEYTQDSYVAERAKIVRDWVSVKLLRGRQPSPTGNVMIHPVHVRITGVLFYDDAHVGDRPRGKKKMKAITLWEIHPVTLIEFVQ